MTNIDPEIVKRLSSIKWAYADKDFSARKELEKKIAKTGRNYELISYSSLVENIPFMLPAIGPNPRFIRTNDWQGLDRRIVGDFLGHLNMESYIKAGFFSSALVIGKEHSQPSDIFFEWMESIGILPNLNEDTVLKFWVDEVHKAHRFYNNKPV